MHSGLESQPLCSERIFRAQGQPFWGHLNYEPKA